MPAQSALRRRLAEAGAWLQRARVDGPSALQKSLCFTTLAAAISWLDPAALLNFADTWAGLVRDVGQQVGAAGVAGAAGAAAAGGSANAAAADAWRRHYPLPAYGSRSHGPEPGSTHRTYEEDGAYIDHTPGPTGGYIRRIHNRPIPDLWLVRDRRPDRTVMAGRSGVKEAMSGAGDVPYDSYTGL